MGREFVCDVLMTDLACQTRDQNYVCADGDGDAGDALMCPEMKEMKGRRKHYHRTFLVCCHENSGIDEKFLARTMNLPRLWQCGTRVWAMVQNSRIY